MEYKYIPPGGIERERERGEGVEKEKKFTAINVLQLPSLHGPGAEVRW